MTRQKFRVSVTILIPSDGITPFDGTRQTYIQTSTRLLHALFLLLAGCSQELPGVFTALAFLAGGAILILK